MVVLQQLCMTYSHWMNQLFCWIKIHIFFCIWNTILWMAGDEVVFIIQLIRLAIRFISFGSAFLWVPVKIFVLHGSVMITIFFLLKQFQITELCHTYLMMLSVGNLLFWVHNQNAIIINKPLKIDNNAVRCINRLRIEWTGNSNKTETIQFAHKVLM